MPALLLTVALASGQPLTETVRPFDPSASARVQLVQDLSTEVSGVSPSGSSAAGPISAMPRTGSVTIQTSGAGFGATNTDTGAGSVGQSTSAISARLVMPTLPGF